MKFEEQLFPSDKYSYHFFFLRYRKADADLNLSRAEVEKQRVNSTLKSQQCEDSKNEYANQLQKTNQTQVEPIVLFLN